MTGSRRAAWLAAGAVVVVLAIVAVVVWQASDDDGSDGGVVAQVESARAPFACLTAGTISVGGKQLRVVVADAEVSAGTSL